MYIMKKYKGVTRFERKGVVGFVELDQAIDLKTKVCSDLTKNSLKLTEAQHSVSTSFAVVDNIGLVKDSEVTLNIVILKDSFLLEIENGRIYTKEEDETVIGFNNFNEVIYNADVANIAWVDFSQLVLELRNSMDYNYGLVGNKSDAAMYAANATFKVYMSHGKDTSKLITRRITGIDTALSLELFDFTNKEAMGLAVQAHNEFTSNVAATKTTGGLDGFVGEDDDADGREDDDETNGLNEEDDENEED